MRPISWKALSVVWLSAAAVACSAGDGPSASNPFGEEGPGPEDGADGPTPGGPGGEDSDLPGPGVPEGEPGPGPGPGVAPGPGEPGPVGPNPVAPGPGSPGNPNTPGNPNADDDVFMEDDQDQLIREDPAMPMSDSAEVVAAPECTGDCPDLPAAPLIVEGTPVNASDPASGFAPPSGSGVCVIEPPDGALMPANWTPPLFWWSGSDTLWEITVSSPQQANDLHVYTNDSEWIMPSEMWFAFAANNADNDVTVTIRGQSGASATTSFHIAPVRATGTMVYAALKGLDSQDPTNSWLEGFNVGDVNTSIALLTEDIVDTGVRRDTGGNVLGPADQGITCIGCHTSTPGGDEVAFTDTWPWSNVVTSIQDGQAGQRPDYLTEGAINIMAQAWLGMQTYSEGHWEEGDRVAIMSYGAGLVEAVPEGTDPNNLPNKPWTVGASDQPTAELVWVDLEAPEPATLDQNSWMAGAELMYTIDASWGFLARTGDMRGAMTPDWSNDGERVAYVSTNCGKDGRLGCGKDTAPIDDEADLFVVPYADRLGGMATPVDGASEPGVWEYYPEFSSDDRFLAFNRVDNYQSTMTANGEPAPMYYNPNAEIWVVPSEGGEAVRLAANDPVSCDPRGAASPGAYNSWPKWSPRAVTGANGKTYYWLIFQSARDPEDTFNFQGEFSVAGPNAKLYLAGIVVENGAIVETSPALLMWAQNPETLNLTPAWDTFPIPPPPDVPRARAR